MGKVRVVIEYTKEEGGSPIMRWERMGVSPLQIEPSRAPESGPPVTETFELLGRAFEVAQREEDASFAESLLAFFRGALVRKEDLKEVLASMEEQ